MDVVGEQLIWMLYMPNFIYNHLPMPRFHLEELQHHQPGSTWGASYPMGQK
jgi:hypothetical protein